VWRVDKGDIIEWLQTYDGPRFHVCFSDPPYALGFMGKAFDTFKSPLAYQQWVTEWATLLIGRALYPGAVCAFFGGTRTIHRLACGLEDAGFEVADTVAWIYAGGFPKSLDLSKVIDKEAGAAREVVGRKIDISTGREMSAKQAEAGADKGLHEGYDRPWRHDEDHAERMTHITVPATPDAMRFDGYGTALKPAHEDALIVRAPRNGLRYVDLALQCGTGALNIDGGRVGNNPGVRTNGGDGDVYGDLSYNAGTEWQGDNKGRWPANLIFSHRPDCTDGACVEGCPVRELGEQSGERKSGQLRRDYKQNTEPGGDGRTMGNGWSNDTINRERDASTGTAARFFYCAKASRAERDAGLNGIAPDTKRIYGGGIVSADHPETASGGGDRAARNTHPTVKPLGITEYISRLLLPPSLDEPRRILVPFAGSGSEMIGAMRAGFEEIIGVEMDADYAEIARARLRYWQEHGVQTRLI
jgi:DNA modification methylase